jgi:hypothetical protein
VFDHTFDGFYTPAPADVPSGGRWPWAVAAVGVAVIVAGGVAFSGGITDHPGPTPSNGPESSASR